MVDLRELKLWLLEKSLKGFRCSPKKMTKRLSRKNSVFASELGPFYAKKEELLVWSEIYIAWYPKNSHGVLFYVLRNSVFLGSMKREKIHFLAKERVSRLQLRGSQKSHLNSRHFLTRSWTKQLRI